MASPFFLSVSTKCLIRWRILANSYRHVAISHGLKNAGVISVISE
jgi:hypothetical protein